jgi:Ion channel
LSFSFTFFLLIIGNLLSCFWYLLGSQTNVYSGYSEANHQDIYIDGWIDWFIKYSGEGTRYITSLYWTFTTLSTLGYGDIYGRTNSEYLYSMFVEVGKPHLFDF